MSYIPSTKKGKKVSQKGKGREGKNKRRKVKERVKKKTKRQGEKKIKNSPTGIRTPVFHVTGEDTEPTILLEITNISHEKSSERREREKIKSKGSIVRDNKKREERRKG